MFKEILKVSRNNQASIFAFTFKFRNAITQKELDHLTSSISTRCKDVLYMKGHMYKY